MAIKLKELAEQEERLTPGHRACAGCAQPVIVRQVLHAINYPVVVAAGTGCLQTVTTIYPYTAWRVPWIHSAFENAATTISCIEAAYRSLVRQGKIQDRNTRFVAFGGDGATYDIGLQWLSGAVERGHRFLYVCLNNEAYMNTGIQRSSATPLGAWTTTSPVGSVLPGKMQWRKDLTGIMAAHPMPYVAQVAPHAWRDLMTKVQRAVEADGPSFINALSPCPRGWRYDTQDTMAASKLAADTCIWPLYEIDHGVWRLNYRPKEKKPITEWLESQGRFRHLLTPQNKGVVEEMQRHVDEEWQRLLERCQTET
ncbi:MAG TPA: pyruvate ferredoxin oxidoreductase [Dehalococcoidia bacterium]|nr:pyruvate ferredoxin oxidoreductase [Dehalococcoidia bacterium]